MWRWVVAGCLAAAACLGAGSTRADGSDPADDLPGGATPLPSSLVPGQTAAHDLGGADLADWYALSLQAGYTYHVDSAGGAGDIVAELYSDAAGTQLVASDANGAGGGQFSLDYPAAQTRTYYLRVRSAVPGGGWSGALTYWTENPLQVSLSAAPEPSLVGQWIRVSFTVTNTSPGWESGAVASCQAISGTPYVVYKSGPAPASANIKSGGAQTFSWSWSVSGFGGATFVATVSVFDTRLNEMVIRTAQVPVTLLSRVQLTSSLAFSPAPATPGDLVQVVLTVSNSGTAAAIGVAPAIRLGIPDAQLSFSDGPTPVGGVTVAAGGSAAFTWVYRIETAGSVTVNATASGLDAMSGQPLLTGAAGSLVVAGSRPAGGPGAAVPYPNPVNGDRVCVPMALSGDAREVRVRMYNMRMQRVYAGAWRDVASRDTLQVDGMRRILPGRYLLTVEADLRDGGREAPRRAKVLVTR